MKDEQLEVVQPEGWAAPVGYANGVVARGGRLVFVAGQVGWDPATTTATSGTRRAPTT